MHKHCINKRHGQVLVMVTFALFVMCGMLGLVVDLGWSYFMRKSAQAAADAAALAAVKRAQDLTGSSKVASAYACGAGGVTCAAVPVDCPGATGNLATACFYAAQQGFSNSNPRQHVTVQAWDQSSAPTVTEPCGQSGATIHRPPTTGCVDTYYWVTVRVAEQIPQLFSAILGNTLGLTSARATAAVATVTNPGALFLVGRGEPWNPSGGPVPSGTNLWISGGPDLNVPPGINLASTGSGPPRGDGYAGYISGSGTVTAGHTVIREGGDYDIQGSGSWSPTPTNADDGDPAFIDPYEGMGQPPLTNTVLTPRPVFGGTLTCTGPCISGNYFAATTVGSTTVATGDPIVINSNVTFSDGGFGDFHFFGGLRIVGAQVDFGPGRYVIAGVNDQTTPVLDVDNRAMILSIGDGAGRIFILTDSMYPGLSDQVASIRDFGGGVQINWPGPVDTTNGVRSLYFSKSSIKTGNNAASGVQLRGLIKDDASLLTLELNGERNVAGSSLNDFAGMPINNQGGGVVIWQDQGNSYVKFTSDGMGTIDTSCGSYDDPCMNTYPDPAPPSDSPQLEIWATPYADLQGVIYQPRGAWTLMQANGDYTGALRIVSGAMKLQGTGRLTMTGPSSSFTTYKTALIE